MGISKWPAAGPALVAGDFEQVDGVEAVVAELDFANRPAARVGDPHGRADDATFVQRRIPGRLQALRGGEHAPERRPDIFAEDIRHAQMRFAVMKRHADGLDERCHKFMHL